MKIELKMILGFVGMISVFIFSGYSQFLNSNEIEEISNYHFAMSIPSISILENISSNSERMHLAVFTAITDDTQIKDNAEFLFYKSKTASLINEYADLTFFINSNGEYHADEIMRSNMQRFSSDMNESITRLDSIAQEIFLLDASDNVQKEIMPTLLNSYDKESEILRVIILNDLIMEKNGSLLQQNKIEGLIIQESNLFLIFTGLQILTVSVIFLIFRNSIKNSIKSLSKLTASVSLGKFSSNIDYKNNDEFVPVANDIKIMKKKLQKSHKDFLKLEKLSSIGILSSRIAHDLRTPLFIIKGNLQLLEMRKGKELDYRDKENFHVIDNAVNNMSSIIERVLDHVRTRPAEINQIDSFSLIEDTLNSIIIPKEITIIKPSQNFIFSCDPKQIQVVFSNLITNSIQSMNKKGHIEIRLRETEKDLLFEFEDSGPGIPTNILSKIFDPLFTTKSSGTGLGLLSCKNIVTEHNGSISVKNNPTVFTVKLPKAQEKPNVEITPYNFQH